MKKMVYGLIYLSMLLVFSGLFLLKPVKYTYTNIGNNKGDKSLHTDFVNKIDDIQLRKDEEEKAKAEALANRNVSVEINRRADTQVSVPTDGLLSGKVSYYSLQCAGCSGNLGSGAQLDGVFYNDPTYGPIRAIACGKEYSYGTVVAISGTPLGDFYGICLDRGGMIGETKKRVFDILVYSNEEAYQYGISNVTYSIIRNGY